MSFAMCHLSDGGSDSSNRRAIPTTEWALPPRGFSIPHPCRKVLFPYDYSIVASAGGLVSALDERDERETHFEEMGEELPSNARTKR